MRLRSARRRASMRAVAIIRGLICSTHALRLSARLATLADACLAGARGSGGGVHGWFPLKFLLFAEQTLPCDVSARQPSNSITRAADSQASEGQRSGLARFRRSNGYAPSGLQVSLWGRSHVLVGS